MKKLKIGIIGVGRLGYEHACNIANRVPGSELVAIADANFDRAKQVAEELGVTAVYNDPKALCADPNVEAVAIITNTASHVEMIKIAMDAGKHVFCEKPLADTVEKCKEAEAIIAAHPELTFMLGFMRRYDHSYQVAKKKMENGDIGDVILVRCYSQDPISIIEGTLEYAPRSGGQFIDMSIHDFDLIRWLRGQGAVGNRRLLRVQAVQGLGRRRQRFRPDEDGKRCYGILLCRPRSSTWLSC
mgnify:CR=1 FL=1